MFKCSNKASSRRCLLLAVVVLLVLGGCSEDEGALRGSLSDFYDLTHSSVRARLYSSELSIEYVRDNAQVPVRVSIRRSESGELSTGEYNLGDVGSITGRSGDNDIPTFLKGSLTLDAFQPSNGSRIQGSFSARFATGRDEASLAGDFDTTLEVVDQIQGYDADLSYLYDAGDAGDVD